MLAETTEVTKAYTQYCKQQMFGDSVKLSSLKINKTKARNLDGANSEKKIDTETKISFYEDIANSDGWTTGAAEILGASIIGGDGESVTTLLGGEKVILRIQAKAYQHLASPIIGFMVKDRLGQALFGENTYADINPNPLCSMSAGEAMEAEFIFFLPLLPNGDYSITVSIADGNMNYFVQHHFLHNAIILTVQSPKLRYGLVGLLFDSVLMYKLED
jgi:lipopolysaccharide transport system ATP-binding protein